MSETEGKPAPRRIVLANESPFEIGLLSVVPAELRVRHLGGESVLQPRVMQVLVALSQAGPGIVSRDQIIEQCWEGRIVGDDAINRCILSLRNLARDLTPPPFAIETVPRVGHRLIAQEAGSPAAAPASSLTTRRPAFALAIAMLALAVLVAGFWAWSRADRQSVTIAVLPFRSLSQGDPFLAEGISGAVLDQLAG